MLCSISGGSSLSTILLVLDGGIKMKVYNDGKFIAYVSTRKNDYRTEVTIMKDKGYQKLFFDTDADALQFLDYLGYHPSQVL